jgi:hypothetical protein
VGHSSIREIFVSFASPTVAPNQFLCSHPLPDASSGQSSLGSLPRTVPYYTISADSSNVTQRVLWRNTENAKLRCQRTHV